MKLFRQAYLYLLIFPVLCIIIGAVSNQAVLIANHGTFPVMLNDVAGSHFNYGLMDDYHTVMTDSTRLNFLADIFDAGDSVLSIGDLLIDLGRYLWRFTPYLWGFLIIKRVRELAEIVQLQRTEIS